MRQGKLSELIHNSAQYPDLDDCSVEVHFREIIDLVRSATLFRVHAIYIIRSLVKTHLRSFQAPHLSLLARLTRTTLASIPSMDK